MATLYTRVYTYTGQGSWTAAARTAPWSSFVETGDTDHSIGQLVSIQYEHYHASGSSRTWALTGQLTIGSTTIQSDTVSNYISGNSDVIKYTNTFTTLPTLSQFNSITSVQTLANGTSANNGVLTWTARSTHPLRVIVSYYEEPPWVYHPQILSFELKRGTSSGVQDDSGTWALLTLKLALASSSYASSSTLRLYYSTGAVSTSSTSINLSSYVSTFLSGVTNNYTYITTTFNADYDYNFLLVFSCGGETATAAAVLQNSAVALHISEYGVAIGDQVVNTSSAAPTFECYNPASFYGGLLNVQAGTIGQLGATATGSYQDGEATFATPFAAGTTPVVVICFRSDSTAGTFGRCSVAVVSATNTGFTFRFFNGDSSNRNPDYTYIAFGTPA